jgi:LEA14-like dessication related protein
LTGLWPASIAGAVLLVVGCASVTESWETPEVALVGLQPTAIGFERQSFIARLRITNPNDRTLPIQRMTYRLSVEGNEIANGAGELDRQIPAFGEETVDVEVNSNLLDLLSKLPVLALQNDSLEWTISGTVGVLGGMLPLPYRYSGEIDPRALMSALRP